MYHTVWQKFLVMMIELLHTLAIKGSRLVQFEFEWPVNIQEDADSKLSQGNEYHDRIFTCFHSVSLYKLRDRF